MSLVHLVFTDFAHGGLWICHLLHLDVIASSRRRMSIPWFMWMLFKVIVAIAMLMNNHWLIFKELRNVSSRLIKVRSHENFLKECIDEDLRVHGLKVYSYLNTRKDYLRQKCENYCMEIERKIRYDYYVDTKMDRKQLQSYFQRWKMELRRVVSREEFKYLMNKIKSEMNRESYKVDRIKSKKLYNLRRNKLQVESKVDRNKDTNSNDTGGNTETEKIRERLRAVRRQKNNNRRKLRKHKERKEMDRKKRRKERINNRLKELKHILEVTLNENETEATVKMSDVIIKDSTNWLFTESDLSLCAKGQKFIPKPLRIDLVKKYEDFTSFCRKLRLALYHSRRRREITVEGSESQGGGPERI